MPEIVFFSNQAYPIRRHHRKSRRPQKQTASVETLHATSLLYVTIISAYLFSKDVLPARKKWFPILIALASFGIAVGCLTMWSWIKGLQNEMKLLAGDANSSQYSSLFGIKVTIAVLVTIIIFGLFNIFYAFYGNF